MWNSCLVHVILGSPLTNILGIFTPLPVYHIFFFLDLSTPPPTPNFDEARTSSLLKEYIGAKILRPCMSEHIHSLTVNWQFGEVCYSSLEIAFLQNTECVSIVA